jgi:hypothetical protein
LFSRKAKNQVEHKTYHQGCDIRTSVAMIGNTKLSRLQDSGCIASFSIFDVLSISTMESERKYSADGNMGVQ